MFIIVLFGVRLLMFVVMFMIKLLFRFPKFQVLLFPTALGCELTCVPNKVSYTITFIAVPLDIFIII